MAIIDKIKLSGQTFEIQDSNASKTVELTQAEYNALVTKDPNTYYIITDAEAVDITNYYTKSETDDLLDDKLDVTAYTPTDLSNYYTKSETSGATQIQTALNGKADSSTVNSLNNVVTAHTASTTVHVTSNEKATWNAKSDFSGDYNDLDNKPTIPTVPTSNTAFTNDAGYITSDDISGKADTSAVTEVNNVVTAHTANTAIHVTAADKSNWNNKSDFSGNYNDLTNKPTIPSKTSDLTNDSDFATTGDVQTATNDMATKTWVGNQGYLTEHQSLSNYYTKSETSGATQISTALASKADTATTYTKSQVDTALGGKQNTLVSGTNVKTINNESILGSGNIVIQGGSTYTAGRGIDITNDTISFSLPISAGTGANSIGEGSTTTASGDYSHAEGYQTYASGYSSHAEGYQTFARGYASHAEGYTTFADNDYEHASGYYNNSVSASTTFGNSGNTLFSVGNGSMFGTHNAFEIRQDGSIYIPDLKGGNNYSDRPMLLLQDALGGGSTYTAGDGIDITNDVISVTGKVDTSTYNTYTAATDTALASKADTATTYTKSQVDTALASKQTTLTAGTNITIVDNVISAEGGVNVVQTTGTSTADVMSQNAVTNALNNKANKSAAVGGYKFGSVNDANYILYTNVNNDNIGNSIYYPKINGKGIFTNNSIYAQNNYNFQLVETSAITTSVTSSSTDAQVPSAKAVNDKLGGLSLVKLTQAEYDALATKDSNTLYVING